LTLDEDPKDGKRLKRRKDLKKGIKKYGASVMEKNAREGRGEPTLFFVGRKKGSSLGVPDELKGSAKRERQKERKQLFPTSHQKVKSVRRGRGTQTGVKRAWQEGIAKVRKVIE